MPPDRWGQIQDLYHSAIARQPTERGQFLAAACTSDPQLRREVESLLAHEGRADGLFETALWNDVDAPAELPPGSRLAGYRIVEKLGSGGMGDVYRATDDKLRREVALKVLASGFVHDSPWVDRFQREARILASLNHPHIAAIYGLEESSGLLAIAMELVEGSTLAKRLSRGRLPLTDSLAIAVQIAEALEYAHEKGIVHRDLKPSNIMVTGSDRIKLLDFGLAQQLPRVGSDVDTPTGVGEIAGTLGYMSPEQLHGLPVDRRTDLFSFGVILHELVTGTRPVDEAPRDFGDTPVPGKLKTLIRKLLEKDPAHRYQTAADVHHELKTLQTSLQPVSPVKLSRNSWIVVCAVFLLVSVIAGWLWRRSSRERWALQTAAPEVARRIDAGEYVTAATLATEARAVLPQDPTLEQLWLRATGEVSMATDPPGADVSIRPYRGDPNRWQSLGKTPLRKLRVPRDAYLWRVTKPGFAPVLIIGEPAGKPQPGFHVSFDWTLKLRPEATVPGDMVFVPAGRIGLGYPLGTAATVKLAGFLIDRHEVTNQQYRKFVESGGYQKREFWKQPLVRDGRTLAWEDAVALFRDTTGTVGPATWETGDYPKGHENYPVAGVSWYEAAAYAEFAGRSLPTAYHWTLASQAARFTPLITPGSNFLREGTQPVGSDTALSGFGTTDMAGNVKEWCLNEARDGKRFILGGGFGEPTYTFNFNDAQSPWDRLPNFGFRCVKLDSPPAPAATARIEATTRDYWKDKPVSDETFKAYTALYAYDKGELNAHVEPTATLPDWSREKVTFDAAYGHEVVTAYLFVPKNATPPFQIVVLFPGAYAFLDDKLDLSSAEDAYDFFLKSGRVLIAPVFKGMYERHDGFTPGRNPLAFQRDHEVAWSKDLGRTLDYLETRKDMDVTKVAYFGASVGGTQGALQPAIEKRIKVAILSSGGLQLTTRYPPEADPMNFVGHVTIPVLMLNGRYDASFPLESSQRPLLQFLGTPARDKKHVIYEGGHGAFPRPEAVRECLNWLDRYLGRVKRN